MNGLMAAGDEEDEIGVVDVEVGVRDVLELIGCMLAEVPSDVLTHCCSFNVRSRST